MLPKVFVQNFLSIIMVRICILLLISALFAPISETKSKAKSSAKTSTAKSKFGFRKFSKVALESDSFVKIYHPKFKTQIHSDSETEINFRMPSGVWFALKPCSCRL